jgi:thiol:disulfide interchange protein
MCCNDEKCIPPDNVDYSFSIKGNPASSEVAVIPVEKKTDFIVKKADSNKTIRNIAATPKINLKPKGMDKQEEKSLLMFFLISFFAGLLAIVTPCVFPMIPMTVTFFMHDSGNKRKARFQAIVYALSIILIYTVIGTLWQ